MSDHPLRRLIQKITGQDTETAAIRESLEEVIEESDRESPALSAQERVMLGNMLNFGELKLADVMVPRAEIVAVDETIDLAALLTLFREAQHSRLPMYRETLDDPTGLIHVKELWRDRACLDRHFGSGHIAAWRAGWAAWASVSRATIWSR